MKQITSKYPVTGFTESQRGGRTENQDFVSYADTPLGFVVVLCDGMGGGPSGQKASRAVASTFLQTIASYPASADPKQAATWSIEACEERIKKEIEVSPQEKGMGTTIVALIIGNRKAVVAHVGDSRLYQLRKKKTLYRTADHSVVGEQIRAGIISEEEARKAPKSNVLTRAIMGSIYGIPDIKELPFEQGDRFVLCTDGVWGAMPEPELVKMLSATKSAETTVEKMTAEVEKLGKASGGKHDNHTLVVLDAVKPPKGKTSAGGSSIGKATLILSTLLILSLAGNGFLAGLTMTATREKEKATDSLLLTADALRMKIHDMESMLEQSEQDHRKSTEEMNNLVLHYQQQLQAAQNEVERLKHENTQAQQQAKKVTTTAGGQVLSPVEAQNIRSARGILGRWLRAMRNKEPYSPVVDTDIEALEQAHLRRYSSNRNVSKALQHLQSAKQSYRKLRYADERQHIAAALQALK